MAGGKITKAEVEKIAANVKDVLGNETAITIISGKRKYNVPDYVMIFQAAGLFMSKELKPASCKLLMYMWAKTIYGNYIDVDIKTMMEELELSKPTVLNGLKQLKEMNVILTVDNIQDKRRSTYIINPVTAWKGTVKQRLITIKTLQKQIGKNQLSLPLFVE